MSPESEQRTPRWLTKAVLAACVVALLGILTACGSSSSGSSESSSTTSEASSGSSTVSESEGSEEAAEGSGETKVYAEGVPTLAELYEGEESPPPSSSPPAKKGLSVIWVSCGEQAFACSQPVKEFGEAAKTLGWKFRSIDGAFNVNEGFSNGLRTAIAAHPDVILGQGFDCELVKQPLEEAKAAGIAVVEAEGVDCAESGPEKLFDIPVLYQKGVENTAQFWERVGERQAAYVIDATEGKAKTILLNYQGAFGKYETAAQKRVLEKCSECEIVAEVPWEAQEQIPNGPLLQRFSTALIKYPEANSVIFSFDSMALAAELTKAIIDSGRQDELIVAGGEGTPEALQVVEEEKGITAEPASHDWGRFAYAVADEINRWANGEESVPEGSGFTLVDLGHNMPPKGHGFESPLEFQKEYQEAWSGK